MLNHRSCLPWHIVIETPRGRYAHAAACDNFAAVSKTAMERFNPALRPNSEARIRGLLDGLTLAGAVFQKLNVIEHVFIAGILALSGSELLARALVVATQHVGIALVVQDFGGRSDNADGLGVGAVGEIEAAQTVIGRGQAEPGFRVTRAQFSSMAEIFLGQSEIVGA